MIVALGFFICLWIRKSQLWHEFRPLHFGIQRFDHS